MKKSTFWRAAALGVAATFALTACSSSPSPSITPPPAVAPGSGSEDPAAATSAADTAALAAVKVEGKPGEQPTVTFDKPFKVSAVVSRVVSPGTGEQITADMTISVNVVEIAGEDGKITSTTYDKGPDSIPIAKLPPDLSSVIIPQKVGARVMFGYPAVEGQSGSGMLLLEIVSGKVIAPASAKDLAADAPGMPQVTRDAKGAPKVTIPKDFKVPTEVERVILKKGDGALLTSANTIQAHYLGVKASDGEEFDSSWSRGTDPIEFPLTGVIEGWTVGLTGVPVGSQVLLVIPSELAYGDSPPQGSTIKAGDTLIFVVDVIAVK